MSNSDKMKILILLTVLLATEKSSVNGALQKLVNSWSSTPINYEIDATLSAPTQARITALLTTTIPDLIPGLTFTAAAVVPYIKFVKGAAMTNDFCEDENVQIGALPSAPTNVIIYEGSSLKCDSNGWILHLLMHALGFYHEHQRSDRGRYVYVNAGNSQLSSSGKAALLDVKTSGVVTNSDEYDYESVTHYHYTATAMSGKTTIVALPAEYFSTKSYGHSTNPHYTDQSVLSFGDIAALKSIFPGAAASTPQHVCYNGGTWHNWCLCKPGYAGRFCNETFCYKHCQNSGYCGINSNTGLPGCVCPSGYSGNYCEIVGANRNCTSEGTCPWWSSCNVPFRTCTCDPYPFVGATCSAATIAVPTSSTTSTRHPSTTRGGGDSQDRTTTSSPPTTTRQRRPRACTAANVGAPRSVTFAANAVYLRLALSDIEYQEDYANLGSSASVALQNFLAEALQGDYQTQSSGQFISVLVQNIQPPTRGEINDVCTVVDFLAKFTSDLTPLQRTHVVQATYAKATSSNLPSLFGTLGTNRNKATRVPSVLYITPLNSAISPASPCVVYSSEGSCKNGGTCTGSGSEPTCICTSDRAGTYCDEGEQRGHYHLAWPVWQIVVVSIAIAIVLLLIVIIIIYAVRQSQNKNWRNYMWNSPDRYYDFDMRARQMQMMPSYMVPAEPPPIQTAYPYPPQGGAGAGQMPPPYGAGQRPKHYQYGYNIQ